MRYIVLLMLMLAVDCLARSGPATDVKIYLTNFPTNRISPLEGTHWSGTTRTFQGDDGKLFYFEILRDTSYERYCNAQLEAAGMKDFTIEDVNIDYRQQKEKPGFQPHPNRIEVNFGLRYKDARRSWRGISFAYMLPASSLALGQTPGFSKLGRDRQAELCVESVTADMKSIADQVAQRLKNGPISVGGLTIPYDPSSASTNRTPTAYDYDIGFINKTGQNLYNVSLFCGEQEACAVPDVVTRQNFNRSDKVNLKWPAQVTLRWGQAVGLPWPDSVTKHSATLEFGGVVPPDFANGTIYIVIRTNDVVEVRPIKNGDDNAMRKVFRGN